MDLIVKPTELCNFKCTFCSSTKIADDNKDIVELEDIRKFLVRFPETATIIINGGDPLMMPPEYYWSIIAMLDELKMDRTTISLTTNLWAFYKKPERWAKLFDHHRVGVCTSFQYGNARLKGDLKPFTEDEFWACSDMMLKYAGYRPDFIAVITPENENTVIETVSLARRMGVEAKINYAVGSGEPVVFKGVTMGNAGKQYLLADIYERYLRIFDAGLMQWEFSTKQMAKKLQGKNTECPLNRDCDSGIRSLQPSGRYYSCGAFGDDNLYPIDFAEEMAGPKQRPLQKLELQSLKQDCLTCPMFEICNGCKKTIHDMKTSGTVEAHCVKMKALAPRIIEANGMTGKLIPTPYVREYPEAKKIIPITSVV